MCDWDDVYMCACSACMRVRDVLWYALVWNGLRACLYVRMNDLKE